MAPRRFTLLLVAALIAVAAAVFAGCGGDDDSTSSNTGSSETTSSSGGSAAQTTAEEEVAAIEERPTSIGLTDPLKKPPPTGKSVAYLACGAPLCVKLGETLQEAGDLLGWNVKAIPEGVTPEEAIAAWETALKEKPDAIVVSGGYPREVYKRQLQQAVDQGIYVVSQGDSEPVGEGVSVAVDGPQRYEKNGERLAQTVMAKSGGTANVLFASVPLYTSTVLMFESAISYLEENCPECSIEEAEISATSKDPAADTAAQVQKRPDVEYVIPVFGDFATGLPAALNSVGRGDVEAITQANSDATAEYLRKGENVVAVYAYPGIEIQWRIADALARLFNGEDAKVDEAVNYPEWLLTQDNLPEGLKDPSYFPMVEDYEQQYKELWGIE